MKKSSRRLSTYEYFESLQQEYLVCRLRARIYPKPSDKNYWNKVAEGKKTTFCEIAERNGGLPTVLTDSDLKALIEKKIYRTGTHPNFTYRDEEQRESQEYTDMLFYYSPNSDVRFLDENEELRIGKVSLYRPFEKNISINVDEQKLSVPISRVSRIL